MVPFGLRRRSAPEDPADVIDLTEPGATVDEVVDLSVDEPAADPTEPERGGKSQPAGRESRLGLVLGYLTLSGRFPTPFTPAASVAAATLWVLGSTLLACGLTTVVVCLIGDRSLFDPAVFVAMWRMAHLMPVATPDGAVSLVPMLPGIMVWLLLCRACSWLWHRLERGSGPLRGILVLGGSYFVVAALIATSPTSGSLSAPLTQGWSALLSLVVLGVAATWFRYAGRYLYPRAWLLIRAGGAVLGLLLAVSFLVVLVQLLVNWSDFHEKSNELLASGTQPPTRFDAAALGAVQLAFLPNIAIWTAAYLLGAGFVVGTDTIVSPFSVTTGTLPDLPLVTLLPTTPLFFPLLPPLLVALASVVAGAMVRNAGLAGRMRTRLVVGGVVASGCAAAMAVLAAYSSGGLGPGRLDHLGPLPWKTFAAGLLVFGVGQVFWAVFPTVVADLVPFVGPARGWAHRQSRWGQRFRERALPRIRRSRAARPKEPDRPPSIDG